MDRQTPVTVAVDVMGGDHGPDVVVDGVRRAVGADPLLTVILVGREDVVAPAVCGDVIEAVTASEVVAMDAHPAKAVRSRPDSSLAVACRLVKEGRADAFFTTGNTGATLAASLLILRRIDGVRRPALATVIPTADRVAILLDVGANADCKPEHLVQFAHMGRAYSLVTLGVEDPTVGLLNIGEEPTKGSRLAVETHDLMSRHVPAFTGNIEGWDIPEVDVDVIVTDGFTGNVVIKLMEGLAKTLLGEVGAVMRSDVVTRLAGTVLRPRLLGIKERLDPDRYGGAPLLGIDGVVIVAHGDSKERAVASGIAVAARAVRQDLTGRIERTVS